MKADLEIFLETPFSRSHQEREEYLKELNDDNAVFLNVDDKDTMKINE